MSQRPAPNVYVNFLRPSRRVCGCGDEHHRIKLGDIHTHPPHDHREATYHYGCSRCGEYWTEEEYRKP